MTSSLVRVDSFLDLSISLPTVLDLDIPGPISRNFLDAVYVITQNFCVPEPHIVEATKKMWPTLCVRLSQLLHGYILDTAETPRTPDGLQFRGRLVEAALLLFTILDIIPRNHSILIQSTGISSTAQFIPLMAELVFRLVEMGDPVFELIWVLVTKYQGRLNNSIQPGSKQFEAILAKQGVPRACMHFLREELKKSVHGIDGHAVLTSLDLIRLCHVPSFRAFRCTMLSDHVVTLLTQLLERFSISFQHNLDGENMALVCAVLSQCARHLEVRFLEGFHWVVEALDAGLLSHLPNVAYTLEAVKALSGEEVDSLRENCTVLLSSMKPYLVFRSVLNRVLKQTSFRNSEFPGNHRQDTTIRSALLAFHDSAWNTKCVMYQFDDHNVLSCINPRVGMIRSSAVDID
ncbi:hypothetical protein VNI00_009389 [Paramarasmius palmivorus]|uniref:Uncharacterized protein n=1 Tax=Paramarasmius palmivorus TaxID=297713 RepID=A0AAW0CSL4_9AGAR